MGLAETVQLTKVGYEPIDRDHQEFVSLLDKLDAAGNADFPAEGEHSGEHRRVLGEFKQFQSRVDKGLIAFGRSFVKERLPAWFQLHIATMDSALAAHIRNIESGRR